MLGQQVEGGRLERPVMLREWSVTLTVVSERKILDSVSHPLLDLLVRHRRTFSERLIPPQCMTERHRKSFLPVAIKLWHSSL